MIITPLSRIRGTRNLTSNERTKKETLTLPLLITSAILLFQQHKVLKTIIKLKVKRYYEAYKTKKSNIEKLKPCIPSMNQSNSKKKMKKKIDIKQNPRSDSTQFRLFMHFIKSGKLELSTKKQETKLLFFPVGW